MLSELKRFLIDLGKNSSRTTPYIPHGNSQSERYNKVIWNSIRLAVESHNMKINAWEDVLPDALHSIRSLLCTSTNETPYEHMFNYRRQIPSWLCDPGPVLLKRHARSSKCEPLVEPVEVIEANPQYATSGFLTVGITLLLFVTRLQSAWIWTLRQLTVASCGETRRISAHLSPGRLLLRNLMPKIRWKICVRKMMLQPELTISCSASPLLSV